jgi:hypothetical protein
MTVPNQKSVSNNAQEGDSSQDNSGTRPQHHPAKGTPWPPPGTPKDLCARYLKPGPPHSGRRNRRNLFLIFHRRRRRDPAPGPKHGRGCPPCASGLRRLRRRRVIGDWFVPQCRAAWIAISRHA